VLNKTRRTLPIEVAWVFARESGEGTEFPIDGAVEMTFLGFRSYMAPFIPWVLFGCDWDRRATEFKERFDGCLYFGIR
jgi:hypothetical protein